MQVKTLDLKGQELRTEGLGETKWAMNEEKKSTSIATEHY